MAEQTAQSYLDRISIGKEEKAKQDLADQAEDAAIQLAADISAAKKEKRNAERELEEAYAAVPFDSANIVSAKRALTEVSEDLTVLLQVQSDLFPATAAN